MDIGKHLSVDESIVEERTSTLVIGQPHVGMAGVTAVDYLVRHLETDEVGHIAPPELPAFAPFEDGKPRHHSRLYHVEDADLLALVGELFVPVDAARAYTDALVELADRQGVEEIVVLYGIPFAHGPDEHDVFHVSTPGYRERRLADGTVRPSKGGFLDGVAGELVTRSLDGTVPDTGVLITPTHPPGPDIDAALRLLGTLETIYDFDLDETELRQLGTQLQQYYEQLAERMASLTEDAPGSHDFPEDRMYM